MFLAGDFQNREELFRALRDLKERGFTPADLAVFSDEPIEFPRDLLDRPSRMSFVVVTGAVTACLLVIGFVYFTQWNYPLVTGGMPIFSFWATGVVFYELTMLGAILTTFFWFLRESGLLRRKARAPIPVAESGVIAVRVECSGERAEAARNSFESAGAANVRTLEAK